MNPLPIGVLGCANIAVRSLIPAICRHERCALAAVASRDQAKAAPLASQYGCRALSYDALVADPAINAVYVPLPTGLHFEWVIKCLEAGKHVLCEKSLGCTVEEVRQMVALARRKNLLLMENFQFRFHSQHAAVKAILASGLLGELRCFRASFGFPPFADGAQNIRYQKALGGGALLDAGAYTIKAATFMLGRGSFNAEAQRRGGAEGRFCVKAATLRYVPEYEVDVGGAIWLEHESGVVAQTAFGFDNFYQCSYEIWGSKGKLTAKRAFTAPPGFSPEVVVETPAGVEVRAMPADDHFANMLSHFAATILSGAFETEYEECLVQAKLIGDTFDRAGF